MNPFSNSFEKKWTAILLALYVFIMIPLPWCYNTEYSPSIFGIPNFIVGWLGYAVVVMIAIVAWRNACMKRPEYQEGQEDE